MADRDWADVWKLYSQLRDSSEGERSAALASPAMPPEIREEVLALLEQSFAVSQSGSGLLRSRTATPHPEYPPGTEFGRYVITGLLGEGGFGRVYSAHDKDLRRSVAIKILPAPHDGRSSQDPLEEARSASALNHPNILTIHETIEIGGHPAIVMEFVQGRSLRGELTGANGRPLPLETATGYGAQIAQALAAAHAAGIVHRDIKPENILVRPDGYLKLVDFGLAAASGQNEGNGWQPFQGTLRYTSPEQLKGAASSPSSDIFSFGLVLYEMVTGVHPFREGTPVATAQSIAGQSADSPASRNPAIPKQLDRLIMSMLSKETALRPSAKQVADSLANREAANPRASTRWTGRAAAAAFAVAVLATTVGVLAKWGPWTNTIAAPAGLRLKITPLTGNQGRERRPAISSDGRFVVFEWEESPGAPERTMVREIGSDRATELPVKGPFTWVPGTGRIAYRRRTSSGAYGLFTISRHGGDEQEVFSTPSYISAAVFSPDGKYVAYLAPGKSSTALFRFTIASKQHKQLSDPPSPGEQALELSHDGGQIAVRRGSGDVYLSSFPEPTEWRRLFANQTEGESLAWLRDGSGLVTSGFQGSNNSLWLHPFASPGAAIRLTGVGLEAFQVDAAADLNRLVWLHSVDDTNIWRMPASGGHSVRVAASLFRDSDVGVSSAGTLAFRSDRSGFPEIWVSGPNGEAQKRISSLEGFTGSPRWSADGRRLAFDSRQPRANGDIWVADCSGSPDSPCQKPVRLTSHAEADVLPNWSRDGRSLYFASHRTGSWQLWKLDASGSGSPLPEPVQLSTDGGYFAMESADRQWLYYSRIEPPEVSGIWRRPLQGAIPFDSPGELVLPLIRSSTATWNLCGDEVFYQTFFHRSLGPQAQTEIVAFHLKTKRTRKIEPDGVTKISRGLAVTADCQSVYFSRLDRSESNVVWADYEVSR